MLVLVLALARCGGGGAPRSPDGAAVDRPAIDARTGPGDAPAVAPDTGAAPDARAPDTVPVPQAPGPVDVDAGAAEVGPALAGCPGPEAYVGNRDWRGRLEIAAPGFQRCGYWVESSGSVDPRSTSNSLKATLAAKSIATVPPGSYPMIDEPGPAPVALPLCFRGRDGKTAAPGTGTIARRAYAGDPTFDFTLPVPGRGVVRASAPAQGNPAVARDFSSVWLCQDASCPPGKIVFHVPCQVPGLTPAQHRVSFDGGQVELTVEIDRKGGGLGTERGEFTRATGSFKGVAFDQRDYFQLIYAPEHHHFVRHLAVLFDAPVDGACGLEFVNLAGTPSLVRTASAFTVDCQLNRLAELKVTTATL